MVSGLGFRVTAMRHDNDTWRCPKRPSKGSLAISLSKDPEDDSKTLSTL